jgi:hypothetical protein
LEINGPRRVDTANIRRASRAAAGETKTFAAEETSDAQKAVALTGTGPIAAVDTILALQGIDDWADQKTHGVGHGEQLLVLLDEVRDGLLAGGIPRLTLSRLALAISKRRGSFADGKLQTILDEIDLRARVELAKLEQMDRCGSHTA